MKFARLVSLVLVISLQSCALGPRSYDPVAADPIASDSAYPATMVPITFDSHGAQLIGNILIAAGVGPHPTVVLLHGFPGNENNFDLAHTLRRAGWNVLIFHYRGSWGSEGDFSFTHVLEDVPAALDVISDVAFAEANRIDPSRLVVMGHSMGGFAALYTAAHDKRAKAVVSLAGFNFGAFAQTIYNQPDAITATEDALAASLAPLQGATGAALVAELVDQRSVWDLTQHMPALAGTPTLLLAGQFDTVAMPSFHHEPLVAAGLQVQGLPLTHAVLATDHGFSDKRIGLARAILAWLNRVMP